MKISQKEFVSMLVWFQDYGDLDTNAKATEILKKYYKKYPSLKKIHQKLTGNSPNSY